MKKIIIGILLLLLTLIGLKYFGLERYLTFEYLKQNQQIFAYYYQQNQILTIALYFFIYILVTATSIPAATILSLLGGFLFGNVLGVVLVSFASSIGATFAFFLSRYFFADYFKDKFSKLYEEVNQGIENEGIFYLFSLRLIPIIPFWLVNLAMGITKMRAWVFYTIGQIGMLPATIIYVNAGTQLSAITTPKEILSLKIILSFTLLGVFPLFAKWFIDFLKQKNIYRGFKRPKKFDYNMIVIGGGSAGLVTAYICASVKASVALIEKDAMGGECLNTGCVPSKALIRSSKVINLSKKANELGLEQIDIKFNFERIMERIHSVIKKIEPHDSVERYEKLGVKCLKGKAEIISPWEVKVNDQILTTKNITIATGASPLVIPFKGLDKIQYLTSNNLWNLRKLPARMVILGGGPIGCEMAQAFNRMGSKVYLVEMLDRIMNVEDQIVSDFITKKFKTEGIEVLTNHKAKEFLEDKTLICDFNGLEVKIPFDEVLLSLGRKANTLNLGKLNINLRKNGTIETNKYLQTNFPNIFACGDVTGPYQFTHTASHQAWYCAVNGLFGKLKKFKVDYSVIPWCTFLDPEVATVGLNEQTAKKLGIPYQLFSYDISDLDRAIADSLDEGFVRVLTKPGTDTILGATIVAANASDLILEFISAMKNGFGLNDILSTIHIYPTMGEANKYLAGNWKRKQHGPKLFSLLQKFHLFMRS